MAFLYSSVHKEHNSIKCDAQKRKNVQFYSDFVKKVEKVRVKLRFFEKIFGQFKKNS